MKAQEILTAAAAHMSDRASTYDKPAGERSMAQTVEIFNLFHGTTLTEAQGWHFMQVLKDVRLFTRPGYHADSAEDGVAYSALKAEAMAAATPKRWSCGEPIELVAEKSPDESTLDDGWIAWSGGECPVKKGVQLLVRLGDGFEFTDVAGHSRWNHIGDAGDIVAYRISPTTGTNGF
jgi:hypothetical protein